MVDRTDIDALLIGALYGELTPADEARLTAHLESHPADRTALDDLTRTRAAVRSSRILAFQLEPPQAISALLLQEASRRAPRAVTDRGEPVTWFQRFVRSFAAHPAMAAAATLVLVIATAGTLYLRGTDQLARPEVAAVESPPAPTAVTGAAAPSAPSAVRTPEPEDSPAGNSPGESAGALAGSSGEPAAGTDAYRARLDGAPTAGAGNAAAQDKTAEPQAPAAADQVLDRDDLSVRAPYEKSKAGGRGAAQDAEMRKLGALSKSPPAKAAKAEAVHGIELRTRQLQPKDLADDEKPAAGRREGAGEVARDQRNAAVAGGGAPATPPASAPPPPPAPGPTNAQAARGAGPGGAAGFDAPAQAPAQAANEAKHPAKPSANQLPPSANSTGNAQTDRRLDRSASPTNTTNAASGDAKQAQADRTLLEWARKQREQVIAFVNANRCRDAASAAVEIYNRAPDFYNANVATDRQIKPCLAYVTTERDRAERSRNSKNAADVQAPVQAAPARK